MFEALIGTAFAGIHTVQSFIDSLDEQTQNGTAAQQIQVKAYAVSACVTRLYAIYERYVESLISDYLDAMPELLKFDDLPEILRKEYRIGFSSVLGKLDHRQYRNLNHENLVKWYSQAIAGEDSYKLIAHALIRHDDNLRLPTIEGMVARVGLSELRSWVSTHSSILDLYERSEGIVEKLEAEIKSFVELRNDAAHGTLDDDLVGKDILQRHCSVILGLISALRSFFHRALVLERVKAGTVVYLGTVTEVFKTAGAAIIQITAHQGLSKNTMVHMVGSSYCYSEFPKSLRINSSNVQGVSSIIDALEVGYVGERLPRRNAQVFIEA